MIKNPQRSILLRRSHGNKSLFPPTETSLFADRGSTHFPESFPTSPFSTSALPSPVLPPAPFSQRSWLVFGSLQLERAVDSITDTVWVKLEFQSDEKLLLSDLEWQHQAPWLLSKGTFQRFLWKLPRETLVLHKVCIQKDRLLWLHFFFPPSQALTFMDRHHCIQQFSVLWHYRQPAHKYVWNKQPPIGNLLQQRLDLLIPRDPFQTLWFCDSMVCTSWGRSLNCCLPIWEELGIKKKTLKFTLIPTTQYNHDFWYAVTLFICV